MFTMKSILAITATALMLVSATQPAVSQPMDDPMDFLSFMGYQNNDPASPFTQRGIRFNGMEMTSDDMKYMASIMANKQAPKGFEFLMGAKVTVGCRPPTKTREEFYLNYLQRTKITKSPKLIDTFTLENGYQCVIIPNQK
ncbi:hypothetical protein BDF19DRAFT_430550 [Syncephalis fuscata]|nr:hypothetical protein BDF19DRAFT_430550 [Syncephalis fuscata]